MSKFCDACNKGGRGSEPGFYVGFRERTPCSKCGGSDNPGCAENNLQEARRAVAVEILSRVNNRVQHLPGLAKKDPRFTVEAVAGEDSETRVAFTVRVPEFLEPIVFTEQHPRREKFGDTLTWRMPNIGGICKVIEGTSKRLAELQANGKPMPKPTRLRIHLDDGTGKTFVFEGMQEDFIQKMVGPDRDQVSLMYADAEGEHLVFANHGALISTRAS